MEKRRPTRQIERLLSISENGYLSLLKSQRYCETSQARNKDKLLGSIHDMEVSSFAFRAALKWVLGIGLSDQELQRVLVEDEEAMNASSN